MGAVRAGMQDRQTQGLKRREKMKKRLYVNGILDIVAHLAVAITVISVLALV